MDIGAAEIRAWHTEKGWRDIGYHYVIRRSGKIEYGRKHTDVGAHAVGFNGRSVSACMVGGVDGKNRPEDNFTTAQWVSLGRLVEHLTKLYPDVDIVGHRSLSPDKNNDGFISRHEWVKDCPSFEVIEMVNYEPIRD